MDTHTNKTLNAKEREAQAVKEPTIKHGKQKRRERRKIERKIKRKL